MTWTQYLRMLVLTALGVGGVVYLWVLLVDPYGNVAFSIPYDRVPVSGNRHFSNPSLARSDRFDSVITGTSTIRNLRSNQLSTLLGAAFVNLSLDSGTPYQQQQILKVFVRHHPRIRYAVLGIDHDAWCVLNRSYRKSFPGALFPEWMYDDDPWNDLLYVFNWTAVEMAWRQSLTMLGLLTPKYGRDGYSRFPSPETVYDLRKARRHLYGDSAPHIRPPVIPPQTVSADVRAAWTMPTLELLDQMLESLPDPTTKILLLPPRHHTGTPQPGSLAEVQARECKLRLARMAAEYRNAMVVDFMFRSALTLEDRNYWDNIHYIEEVATILGEGIAKAVTERKGEPGLYRVVEAPVSPIR